MPSNGLLNEERRREILSVLHRDGRVLVKDLARHFRISQITIRKDLEFLDGQGVIQRTHGGSLRKTSFPLVGPLAERTLRQLSADILFLGVDGFDTGAGLFTPNLLESEVNRVMVEIARRTVAVCDSSKFGRRSLCNIMPVNAVDEVITDKQIPKSDLHALKDAGVKVTLV